MVAAKLTATELSRVKLDNMELVTCSVVVVTQDDWVLLSDIGLYAAAMCKAWTTADGTDQKGYVSGTDKIKFTVTGTATFTVLAKALRSTGGSV